ncbi:MAG: rod shape-determining protein RodA [Chitinophagaceae bacterium]
MTTQHLSISRKSLDWPLIYIYYLLVVIGVLSIFAVEYRAGDSILYSLTHFNKTYAQQVKWVGISSVLAILVLLIDSKFFTATANILYFLGLLLLLVTVAVGRDIKGSHSWLAIGGFQFQPAELTKVCTNLALAKYLSGINVDFKKLSSRLWAAAIVLVPAVIIIFQNETGIALVYLSFFIVMYREGLPNMVLILGFSIVVLVLSSLLIEKNTLMWIFTGLTVLIIYFNRRTIKRDHGRLWVILGIWVFCTLFVVVAVPFIFKHVLKPYQVERIYVMLGKQASKKAEYNVLQSKIAIGSGGLFGKGFLKGTQTRGEFVPEQSTDFIFCTIGENFGFLGSLLLLGIYLALLMRIILIAERQRSTFSRVYAYGVASIIFFHVLINIGFTIGLVPTIGIPLPLISYGGSSMLTFTLLIFILLRLDADRQMVLR